MASVLGLLSCTSASSERSNEVPPTSSSSAHPRDAGPATTSAPKHSETAPREAEPTEANPSVTVNKLDAEGQGASQTLLELGRGLLSKHKCIRCHDPMHHTKGPMLYGILDDGERAYIDGTTVEITAASSRQFLIEALESPGKRVRKGYEAKMPSYAGKFSPREIDALHKHLRCTRHKCED